jgi:hypothetical protein
MMPRLPGPLTRDEALALVRRRLSSADVRALEATPEGAALLRMLADLHVDQSQRLDRSATARHLIARESDVNPIASGATRARVELRIERRRTGFRLVVPKGTRVETPGGHVFALDAPVAFVAGEAGPRVITATALVAGSASTVLAGSVRSFSSVAGGAEGDEASVIVGPGGVSLHTSGGDHLSAAYVGLYVELADGANKGRIGRITGAFGPADISLDGDGLVAEVGTAAWVLREWGELGLVVAQPTDATAATDDSLDELAEEVDRHRQTGESDGELRTALLTLQDAVSIGAIIRACNRALGTYGPIHVYETGTPVSEAEPTIGLEACPGYVCGLSPCSLAPDRFDDPAAAPPPSPPKGFTAVMPLYRFFVLRWDGAGLDDPGAYVRGSSGVPELDEVPMAAAAGISPAGGYATGDVALRAGISTTIDQIRAAGVGWRWYPRRFYA